MVEYVSILRRYSESAEGDCTGIGGDAAVDFEDDRAGRH